MGIKFSIIIPATRPECVNFAIESAINQNFKKNEYEIILIDNSLSGLKKIIPLEYLKNIKYFKTKKYLTVEKNWEFGFSKAKGFWQLMLCDDDIIDLDCLRTLDKKITYHKNCDCFLWNYGFYKFNAMERKNVSISLPLESKNDYVIDSEFYLKKLFQLGNGLSSKVKPFFPFVPRSVYSKSLIQRIKKKNGTLIMQPDPKVGTGILALIFAKKIIKINKNLTVISRHIKNSAANHINDSSTLEKMMKNFEFKYIPIKTVRFFPSLSSEVLLILQIKFNLSQYKLNISRYFCDCFSQLQEFKNNKKDYKRFKKKFLLEINKLSFQDYFLYIIYKFEKILMPYLNIVISKFNKKKFNVNNIFKFENEEISIYNLKKEIFKNKDGIS